MAVDNALQKGAIKQAGTTHLLLGIASHHTGDEQRCFRALERAQRYKDTKAQTDWWIEKLRAESVAATETAPHPACKGGGDPRHPLPSLGQCYRPSGFEKYLRIAQPEIDALALGEPRLPIALARELDLDAPSAVPALQLDAHHVPGRPHVADHRFDAAAIGMAIDIDLVGTRVDLGRDISDAVEMPFWAIGMSRRLPAEARDDHRGPGQ